MVCCCRGQSGFDESKTCKLLVSIILLFFTLHSRVEKELEHWFVDTFINLLCNHWDDRVVVSFFLIFTYSYITSLMTYHVICIILFCANHSPQCAKIWDNKQNNIMTSRKRNKGKERKAKKAELEAEKDAERRRIVRSTWVGHARGVYGDRGVITPCNHGNFSVIPDDKNHPVVNFIDTFYVNGALNDIFIADNLRDTFTTHQEIWGNKRYRQMAVNIFTSIGTNSMLCSGGDDYGPKNIAYAIVALENYDGSSDFHSVICNRVAASKMRDLLDSANRRDMLKFFRKRISCKCLKGMHLEARKTLPKLGMCYHCKQEKERSLLMVCSRCRTAQYCSRKCHVADWSRHKGYCDECVELVEQQGATNN